jgi:hypothetical protein
MITTADLIVVIVEKERWPSYLQECNKLLFWDIRTQLAWLMNLPTRFIEKYNLGLSN